MTKINRDEPTYEGRRIDALHSFDILDTPRDKDFDDIADLAAAICEVPIAVVNLISTDRQFFKAEVGLGVRETPLDSSFCAKAILEDEFLVVPDATRDTRFNCNPLVTGDPHLRFYAGALLKTEDGFPIGTVCVLDYEPRTLSPTQEKTLRTLARQVMTQLNLRRVLRAQADLGTVINNIPQLTWMADASGSIFWYSQRWYDYTGTTIDEMQGWGWQAVHHPDHVARVVASIKHSFETGTDWEDTFPLRGADGIYRWFLSRARPIRNEVGQIVRWFGSNTDVTELRDTQAALRKSEAALRAMNAVSEADRDRIWNMSTDLMLVSGLDAKVISANPAWTASLDWTTDELVGTSFMKLVHPDDVSATLAEVGKLGEGATTFRFENRYQHRDGSYKVINWTAVPVNDQIYAVGRDVTLERQSQAELLKMQEALTQSQKMEAVGQLTGGIAHDFNNLLAGISGSLELLEGRIAQGRLGGVERYISAAQNSARRATSLTQRLLAFSRRQTLDPKPVDTNKLIAGMDDLIRRTIGPSISLEIVGAGGLWLTKIDPSQLENALLNLSINGRDAMPDGGRLTIETANKWLDDRAAKERELPPGQYVSLCVSDTGTGMSSETVERAFDPFYTTKPIGQGTGLGLSMVHGFVRQSGGQVRIYSELGKGTTMCLYLPRYFGDEEAAGEFAKTASHGDGHGEIVLVIDDEPIIRMLIVEVLEDAGYLAIEAHDGVSGLKILQSEARIDLLITDVGLPGGMNGRQVADAARQLRPQLKVLFVTGYAENAALRSGFLEPGMQVITKPFEMTALGNKVRDMLEQKTIGS